MGFFDKPLVNVTADDVHSLLGVQEGQDVDFKRELPTKEGVPDRWVSTGDKIGEYAKGVVVKELVGFANALGGSVVLGIDETESKPSRAASIVPIPRVVDLAERLRRACRDLIEPILHGLECVGIPLGDDGAGVVVLRVPGPSAYGPHRSRADLQCYIRRNDETMPMTMYEIQRRVLDMSSRLARLPQLQAADGEEFNVLMNSVSIPGWGIRMFAAPIVPLALPRVHRLSDVRPVATKFPVRWPTGGRDASASMFDISGSWKPIVRGSRSADGDERSTVICTIRDDGRLSLHWHMSRPGEAAKPLYLEWIPGMFGNALLGIARLRKAAGASNAEYVLRATIHIAGQVHRLVPYNSDAYSAPRGIGAIPVGTHVLGDYPVNENESFNLLTYEYEQDVMNLAGCDYPNEPREFDFSSALAAILAD